MILTDDDSTKSCSSINYSASRFTGLLLGSGTGSSSSQCPSDLDAAKIDALVDCSPNPPNQDTSSNAVAWSTECKNDGNGDVDVLLNLYSDLDCNTLIRSNATKISCEPIEKNSTTYTKPLCGSLSDFSELLNGQLLSSQAYPKDSCEGTPYSTIYAEMDKCIDINGQFLYIKHEENDAVTVDLYEGGDQCTGDNRSMSIVKGCIVGSPQCNNGVASGGAQRLDFIVGGASASSNARLTRGAILGIVLGSMFFALCLVGAGAFWFFRVQQQRKAKRLFKGPQSDSGIASANDAAGADVIPAAENDPNNDV